MSFPQYIHNQHNMVATAVWEQIWPQPDINMDIVNSHTVILFLVLGISPLSYSYGTGYGPGKRESFVTTFNFYISANLHRSVLSSPDIGYISSLPPSSQLAGISSLPPSTQLGHLSSLPSLPQLGHFSSGLSASPQSEYRSPPCSEHYHAQFPVCSNRQD